MTREDFGKLAAFLLLAAFIGALAAVAFAETVPQSDIPLVDAKAKVWSDVWASPPQFCPTPMPICTSKECRKKETFT